MACASIFKTRRAVSKLIARSNAGPVKKVLSISRAAQEVEIRAKRWRHRIALRRDCRASPGNCHRLLPPLLPVRLAPTTPAGRRTPRPRLPEHCAEWSELNTLGDRNLS